MQYCRYAQAGRVRSGQVRSGQGREEVREGKGKHGMKRKDKTGNDQVRA